MPALKIYKGYPGTSFQLLFFKDQWDIEADKSSFHLTSPNATFFSRCFFFPWGGGGWSVFLNLGEGLCLSKQRFHLPAALKLSLLALWPRVCWPRELLGFILFPSFPLSPWQSTVALNPRYMTCENKWWTAAWVLGLGLSEPARRGPCMSGKLPLWAPGLAFLVELVGWGLCTPCSKTTLCTVCSGCVFYGQYLLPSVNWFLPLRSWMSQYGKCSVCSNCTTIRWLLLVSIQITLEYSEHGACNLCFEGKA